MKQVDFQPIFDHIDQNTRELKTELKEEILTEIRAMTREIKQIIDSISRELK